MRHGRTRRLGAALVGGVLMGSLGIVALSAPAGAVTVTTEAQLQAAFGPNDDTQISLANDISLTCGGGGELHRSTATSVTILGNGHTIAQTCAGQRVMDKDVGGGTITLDHLTITGGNSNGPGGAVRALGTDVVIASSTVTGNTSSDAGFGGGGVFAGGLVTITGSTISDNHATAGQGGGVWTSSDLNITDSTVTGNSAAGATFSFGGGVFASGTVTATRSTFTGNSAVGGGAIQGGDAMVVNSTITGNTATSSGVAIGGGGAVRTDDDATFVYATVAGNTGTASSNVQIGDVFTSFGSVVAQPLGGGVNCVTDSDVSNGYNFSDDSSCQFTATGDRQSAGDPVLGALANNGGPTQTRLPGATSPLLDFIPAASCQSDGAAGITTDQRGVTRPQHGSCDIGAVEVEVAPAVIANVTFTG